MDAQDLRHPSVARADDSVLVVIDCQERLFAAIHEAEALGRRLGIILQGASALAIPVLLTEQYAKGLGPTVPAVAEHLRGARLIPKMSFSCFGAPGFAEALRATDRGTLVLAGVETHVCVAQTALDALAAGYRVQVMADATGTRLPANHAVALERLARAGAVITSREAVLFEWLERADHPAFKTVSGLLK